MDRLYDQLTSYDKEDYYPMHMPGHKRNTNLMQMVNPYSIDITEIEGFDNLHQAEGILKQLSERLSTIYGAKKSFPLVNGSTAGILAGISASVNHGDTVLLARNSHKSVYHATVLMGLKPVYIYPQKIRELPVNGGITPGEIEEALINNKDIKLVIITSPTYEGVVSDIRAIADMVHNHGALLLVDEAHGAHFGFHDKLPKSAVSLGADIVIQSLHKTLPSFTQTAVLHLNKPELTKKVEQYLAIYQSSSPSYLLMAGIDRCISLLEENGRELFTSYLSLLEEFYSSMKELKMLKLMKPTIVGAYGVYELDPSKITVSVRNSTITGHQLQKILREKYHIIMEMEAPEYVLGMTSICDTREGFERLAGALLQIDHELAASVGKDNTLTEEISKPTQILTPHEAVQLKTERIKLCDSEGRISAVFISMFPPGSPLLVPGERIDMEMVDYITWVRQEEITITGLDGEGKDEIEVIGNTRKNWKN